MWEQQESSVVEYGARRWAVTLAVSLATLLEIVDTTIMNVALPTIQGNLSATIDEASWIVTGYIIANVIVIPLSPWLQRRFGRKEFYAASILGFTAASMLCGMADSLQALVFWRIVQGLAGGGLISTSQAILRDTYPAREIGTGQAIFALGVVAGPTLGPTIGGYITDNLSWRWNFLINLCPGLIAGGLVLLYLRNPERPRRLPLDAVGLVLLAGGVGSLQYVLGQGESKDWLADPTIAVFSVLAAAGIVAFVVWECCFARDPIVDLRVLRHRSVTVGSILGMVLGVSLYGSILILPQYVQNSLGFTPSLSGKLIIVRAIAIGTLTPIAAILVGGAKLDARWVIASGFGCVGVANALQALVTTSQSTFSSFAPALILGGIGFAQLFVPLSVIVIASLPLEDVPKATAFFNLSRQLGGSVATAILVTVLDRREHFHYSTLAGDMVLHRPAVRAFLQHGLIAQLYQIVTDQAIILAFADTAWCTAVITLLLLPLVLLLERSTAPSAPSE